MTTGASMAQQTPPVWLGDSDRAGAHAAPECIPGGVRIPGWCGACSRLAGQTCILEGGCDPGWFPWVSGCFTIGAQAGVHSHSSMARAQPLVCCTGVAPGWLVHVYRDGQNSSVRLVMTTNTRMAVTHVPAWATHQCQACLLYTSDAADE